MLATSGAQGGDSSSSTAQLELEVQQAFGGLVAAAKSLDVDRYLAFFDKHRFTSLNADGSVFHSLEEFSDSYRQQISLVKRFNSLEFRNVKITVLDSSLAILVNEYTAQVVLQSDQVVLAGGAGTQVWSKSSGRWKLVNVSSSARSASSAR